MRGYMVSVYPPPSATFLPSLILTFLISTCAVCWFSVIFSLLSFFFFKYRDKAWRGYYRVSNMSSSYKDRSEITNGLRFAACDFRLM